MNVSGVAKLSKFLRGEVVMPRDKIYSQLRCVKNRAVNMHPAIIVQLAVRFARDHELVTAVRSGGHSFAGYGVCENGLVIDLSLMKRAVLDPVHGRIRIDPGILAGELDCITQSFRMAVPLGSCPTVGVAGYALGGGESSLTPKFGYGCDSLIDLEVVTADGKVLKTNAREHPDLFWAMRGAGGNFGVATSLEFQLHSIERVLSGNLRYPIRQARKVLKFLDDFAPTIPDDLFLIAQCYRTEASGCSMSRLSGSATRKKATDCCTPCAATCGRLKTQLKKSPISMNSEGVSTCLKGSIRAIDEPVTSIASRMTSSTPSSSTLRMPHMKRAVFR
jgi:hypothetical protein